jgi:hypothetical protein
MVKRALSVVLGLVAGMAWAEGARPWEGEVTLAAYSKTAMSITGDIAISGPADARQITFGSGAAMGLEPVGDVMADWSLIGSEAASAMVYAAKGDPGVLLNGNTLCGADMPARFVVFSVEGDFVQMAVFGGDQPTGIDAPGLCGTYGFTAS